MTVSVKSFELLTDELELSIINNFIFTINCTFVHHFKIHIVEQVGLLRISGYLFSHVFSGYVTLIDSWFQCKIQQSPQHVDNQVCV